MKFLVVLSIVISAAVFANGFPTESINDLETLGDDFDSEDGFSIKDKIACIKEGFEQVINSNSDLQSLIQELKNAKDAAVEGAKQCKSLSGPQKPTCYIELLVVTKKQIESILASATETQKEALNELKNVVQNCLKNAQ